MNFEPIGVLQTCFREKFGAPRQSLMVREARGVLKLRNDPAFRTALNHLEEFSHLWVIFLFDRAEEKGWRPTIVPPRVGKYPRVGVFASRSPHRPNPIGLSAVKLDRIDLDAAGGIEIHLSGVDILDGTPVIDIKPYLPYADRIEEASSGWAEGMIQKYPVEFSAESREFTDSRTDHPRLAELICGMLEWDPRPRSQREAMPIEAPETKGKIFGFRVLDFEVRWQVRERGIYVLEVSGSTGSSASMDPISDFE